MNNKDRLQLIRGHLNIAINALSDAKPMFYDDEEFAEDYSFLHCELHKTKNIMESIKSEIDNILNY